MGEISRLYPILATDRKEKDEADRAAATETSLGHDRRKLVGPAWLNRLSSSFRSSFRKFRSFRSENKKTRTSVTPAIKGKLGSDGRPPGDCQSLDSGLESCDCSYDWDSSVSSSVRKPSSHSHGSSTADSGVFSSKSISNLDASQPVGVHKGHPQRQHEPPTRLSTSKEDVSASEIIQKSEPKHTGSRDTPRLSSSIQGAGGISPVGDPPDAVPKRVSPSCLVDKRLQPRDSGSKKKVSILLPADRSAKGGGLYGPRLQVARVTAYRQESPPSIRSVRAQSANIFLKARESLVSRSPAHLCDTIHLMFTSTPAARRTLLRWLGVDEIAHLIFSLRTILFKVVDDVPYADVCLFVVQLFMIDLCAVTGQIAFHHKFVDLVSQCEKYSYREFSFWLRETQEVYVGWWCTIIEHL